MTLGPALTGDHRSDPADTAGAAAFDRDDYPGAPRLLFIGSALSSHSHSWIGLLDRERLNIRLFSPFDYDGPPPPEFRVRTYLTVPGLSLSEPLRRNLTAASSRRFSQSEVAAIATAYGGQEFHRGRHAGLAEAHAHERALGRPQRLRRIAGSLWRFVFPPVPPILPDEILRASPLPPLASLLPPDGELARPRNATAEAELVAVIRQWQPHVIHTFGFFEAGRWWHDIREAHDLRRGVRWVMQLRGGSDLEINKHLPAARERIVRAAQDADQIVSDNLSNFAYLRQFGVDERRFAPIAPVPGSGGMDLPAGSSFPQRTSQRRIILWPKAYNTQYAAALPVLEALRLAWDRLPPCRIVMLWAAQAEVREWIETLPPALRAACDVRGKIPREEVLGLVETARVLLAPSLVDGRPNSVLEAMASGAFPIVSPLPTVREFAKEPENVLFARNLYPNEIADALVRAMADDDLVDRAAVSNLDLMRAIADRASIRPRVVGFYDHLARLAAAEQASTAGHAHPADAEASRLAPPIRANGR